MPPAPPGSRPSRTRAPAAATTARWPRRNPRCASRQSPVSLRADSSLMNRRRTESLWGPETHLLRPAHPQGAVGRDALGEGPRLVPGVPDGGVHDAQVLGLLYMWLYVGGMWVLAGGGDAPTTGSGPIKSNQPTDIHHRPMDRPPPKQSIANNGETHAPGRRSAGRCRLAPWRWRGRRPPCCVFCVGLLVVGWLWWYVCVRACMRVCVVF